MFWVGGLTAFVLVYLLYRTYTHSCRRFDTSMKQSSQTTQIGISNFCIIEQCIVHAMPMPSYLS